MLWNSFTLAFYHVKSLRHARSVFNIANNSRLCLRGNRLPPAVGKAFSKQNALPCGITFQEEQSGSADRPGNAPPKKK